MFWNIPQSILDRMAFLEAIDKQDRLDGTSKLARLRQIPVETGRFLAVAAASAPPGNLIEIGTSGGYSGLWLSLACRERNQKLTTFEVLAEKVHLASETFQTAGVQEFVEVIHCDARLMLTSFASVAFCFFDAEKDVFMECYEQIIPNLVAGGFFIADNAISHQDELQIAFDQVFADYRVDAQIVTIGKGLLLCRKIPTGYEVAL